MAGVGVTLRSRRFKSSTRPTSAPGLATHAPPCPHASSAISPIARTMGVPKSSNSITCTLCCSRRAAASFSPLLQQHEAHRVLLRGLGKDVFELRAYERIVHAEADEEENPVLSQARAAVRARTGMPSTDWCPVRDRCLYWRRVRLFRAWTLHGTMQVPMERPLSAGRCDNPAQQIRIVVVAANGVSTGGRYGRLPTDRKGHSRTAS